MNYQILLFLKMTNAFYVINFQGIYSFSYSFADKAGMLGFWTCLPANNLEIIKVYFKLCLRHTLTSQYRKIKKFHEAQTPMLTPPSN